jgi:hypothetical protein
VLVSSAIVGLGLFAAIALVARRIGDGEHRPVARGRGRT